MSRPVLVRAQTESGRSVLANQQVIDAQQTDSLNQLFYKLDIDDRYPIGCVALYNALSPPDQGTNFS